MPSKIIVMYVFFAYVKIETSRTTWIKNDEKSTACSENQGELQSNSKPTNGVKVTNDEITLNQTEKYSKQTKMATVRNTSTLMNSFIITRV